MATYTVARFSTKEPKDLRTKHEDIVGARSAFKEAVRWFNERPEHTVAWVNLISKDSRGLVSYTVHWETTNLRQLDHVATFITTKKA